MMGFKLVRLEPGGGGEHDHASQCKMQKDAYAKRRCEIICGKAMERWMEKKKLPKVVIMQATWDRWRTRFCTY